MCKIFTKTLSRRGFMTTGTAAFAAMTFDSTHVSSMSLFRKKIPIGVQLYSVRDDCKKDLPGVLAAVADMGYEGVEFAGYHDRSANELRKMLTDNGLKCCGTHTAMDTLLGDNFQSTVDFKRELNISCGFFFATPYPGTVLYEQVRSRIKNEESFIQSLGNATEFTINLTQFDDETLFELKCAMDENRNVFRKPYPNGGTRNAA